MAEVEYAIVDTFTTTPYQGNPVGVVFSGDELPPDGPKRIAAELNRSATAFVYLPNMPDHHFGLRWFTPHDEVKFSGHGAIGAVYALLRTNRLPVDQEKGRQPIYIDSPAGLLTARVEYVLPSEGQPGLPIIWLQSPQARLTRRRMSLVGLQKALRLDETILPKVAEMAVTERGDLIVPIPELDLLLALDPDHAELARWCLRNEVHGVCAACPKPLSPALDCHSRYFAPTMGINEDSVSGTVHGGLGLWLVQEGLVKLNKDELAAMKCIQSDSSGRVGLVHVIVQNLPEEGWVALIAGHCAMSMTGRAVVPTTPPKRDAE